MSYNEISINFTHADGRKFRAERGTVDFKIGKEPDHDMFVLRGKYAWGLNTTRDLILHGVDTDSLIKNLIDVFNVSWLDSIKDTEAYFLFSEKYVAHEGPLGIVNISNHSKSLIFADLLGK